MSNIAIRAEHLGKQYRIGSASAPYKTIRETIVHAATAPLRKLNRLRQADHSLRPRSHETFWALRDVSFELKHGEVLGVIGRNGAGKSTLLKVLSRITEPTVGRAEVHGRVGSLLEVGTGFHPELTGRENVYLNGSVLGMDRAYIDRKYDEIVEFAGVEKFVHTPVKRYSSGMYLRLAFAVAAHLEPEILVVDEVLAVGDAAFQEKCLDRMGTVAREGRTILFVSHNMAAVQALCSRCLVMQEGRAQYDGGVEEAIVEYQASAHAGSTERVPGVFDLSDRRNPYPPGDLIIRKVTLVDERGRPTNSLPVSRPASIIVETEGLAKYKSGVVGVLFRSLNDQNLMGINTAMSPARIEGPRRHREQVILRLPRMRLTPGKYWIDVGVDDAEIRRLDYVDHAVRFAVTEYDVYGTGRPVKPESGVVYIDGEWELQGVPEESGAEVNAVAP
jgi:lipopolysaccharide transport system ATP-binding protein